MFSLRRFVIALKALGREEKVFPASVSRLDLRDGDIVVLKLNVPMSMANMQGLNDSWVRTFPNVKCIILDPAVDISTLSGCDLAQAQPGVRH